MVRLESEYQRDLKARLEVMIGDRGLVTKLDSSLIQGIPDLLVLYKKRWALLECKRSINEPYRPNQEWYIDHFDRLSFSAMICPENEEEVLNDLQQALRIR